MSELYAQVLLVDPEGEDRDGWTFVDPESLKWQQVLFLDPWHCEHVETMCEHCIETWMLDWYVQLPKGIEFPNLPEGVEAVGYYPQEGEHL